MSHAFPKLATQPMIAAMVTVRSGLHAGSTYRILLRAFRSVDLNHANVRGTSNAPITQPMAAVRETSAVEPAPAAHATTAITTEAAAATIVGIEAGPAGTVRLASIGADDARSEPPTRVAWLLVGVTFVPVTGDTIPHAYENEIKWSSL